MEAGGVVIPDVRDVSPRVEARPPQDVLQHAVAEAGDALLGRERRLQAQPPHVRRREEAREPVQVEAVRERRGLLPCEPGSTRCRTCRWGGRAARRTSGPSRWARRRRRTRGGVGAWSAAGLPAGGPEVHPVVEQQAHPADGDLHPPRDRGRLRHHLAAEGAVVRLGVAAEEGEPVRRLRSHHARHAVPDDRVRQLVGNHMRLRELEHCGFPPSCACYWRLMATRGSASVSASPYGSPGRPSHRQPSRRPGRGASICRGGAPRWPAARERHCHASGLVARVRTAVTVGRYGGSMNDDTRSGSTRASSPIPADESPTTGVHSVGPTFEPTHPLAVAPVASPPHSVDGFVREFLRELNTGQGVSLSGSTVNDQYLALARTVRHYLMARWLETVRHNRTSGSKFVGYLSAEYLLGRQLGNALMATDLNDVAEKALASCGLDLATLRAQEVEPGLGNGGLGRLAACFIDSLATMSVPCIGYGIRYEYGIFRQTFVDGRQVEKPDTWLALGGPWEFPHPEAAVRVDFGGFTEKYDDTTAPSAPAGFQGGTCWASRTTTWSRASRTDG